MSLVIRPFQETDLADIVDILNPFIQKTAITFDTEPYTEESRKPWCQSFSETGRYQCLVAELNGKVIGYANSSRLREKAAYDTSVEVSIYRAPDVSCPGLGSKLYQELFAKLAKEDIHRAHALITLPNDPSVAIHQKFGFYEVGTLNEAGRKFGRYHSVLWMEKKLRY